MKTLVHAAVLGLIALAASAPAQNNELEDPIRILTDDGQQVG